MALFHDIVQGTDAWFRARVGVATASCFDKILTPTGKLSKQAEEYANTLIAEIITGAPAHKFKPTYWMERGAELEADACRLYEFETGYALLHGGFYTDAAGRIGASPDVRVLDASGKVVGGAEIKCPAPWTHVENLLRDRIDPSYIPQVQGQIYLAGFEFVDWYSFHSDMPSSRITTLRDDKYCAQLAEALAGFIKLMDARIARLAEKGIAITMPGLPRAPKAAPGVTYDEALRAG